MKTWEEAEEARYDRIDQDAVDEVRQQRYEQEKRRKLTDMAIRNQREPWERETPELEGIVDISEGEE